MKTLKFHPAILLSVVLSIFLTDCINDKEPEGGDIALQDTLPQFTVTMNSGEIISTNDFSGKVGFILFFNTSCPDCQQELPVVQELWELYKDESKVMIVPISREEGEEEILQYWHEHDLTMPFSPQQNREVYSLFAKSIIPRIYITNKEGKVVFMSGDTDMPNLQLLVNTINSLL